VTLGNIRASGTVGNIILNGSGASTGAVEFEAKTFGNVTVNTDGASLSFTATPETGAFTVGAVTVDASAVTIDFGSAAGAATISSITITGSGLNTVDVGSAAAVTNGITVTGSGMTVVDLTDLVAGTTVSLQGSSNTIIMSDQGGFVQFRANTGVDAVVFTYGDMTTDTVASGGYISNFQFSGSRLDKIYVGSTAGDWGLASSTEFGTTADGAMLALFVSAGDQTISIASADGGTDTSVIILGTSVDAGSVESALAWLGGTDGVTSTVTTNLDTSAQILLMWYNASGQNTQLHLIDVTATMATTFTAANGGSDLLARFDDDIRLYSGSTWTGVFNIDSN